MKTKDWIDAMSRGGLVCNDYMRKLAVAETKDEIFRVLCDANGGQWLFETDAKGVPLPVDDFRKEFAAFVNGGRVMAYPQGYTSKFYCKHDGGEDIEADTTLVYLLRCRDAKVSVPRNKYPSVILSDGSSADIVLGDGARLNVELYGDAKVNVTGDLGRVRTKRH